MCGVYLVAAYFSYCDSALSVSPTTLHPSAQVWTVCRCCPEVMSQASPGYSSPTTSCCFLCPVVRASCRVSVRCCATDLLRCGGGFPLLQGWCGQGLAWVGCCLRRRGVIFFFFQHFLDLIFFVFFVSTFFFTCVSGSVVHSKFCIVSFR